MSGAATGGSPPQAGVHALDPSEPLPGPCASPLPAGLGAEVVKVERPGGDNARTIVPDTEGALNRGLSTPPSRSMARSDRNTSAFPRERLHRDVRRLAIAEGGNQIRTLPLTRGEPGRSAPRGWSARAANDARRSDP